MGIFKKNVPIDVLGEMIFDVIHRTIIDQAKYLLEEEDFCIVKIDEERLLNELLFIDMFNIEYVIQWPPEIRNEIYRAYFKSQSVDDDQKPEILKMFQNKIEEYTVAWQNGPEIFFIKLAGNIHEELALNPVAWMYLENTLSSINNHNNDTIKVIAKKCKIAPPTWWKKR